MARPIRIAAFSGYLGDRYTAIDEAMAGDPVDVLVGDYLAEVTLAALAARYRKDPSRGYVEYFPGQIRPHLAEIARRGTKVITNAGGFHPAGLAAALRDSHPGLTVAHIHGDNVLGRLAEYQESGHALKNLDTGQPLSSWGVAPMAANAYLGAWGIAAALAEGADIVVCGRVTDASLTVGPAAWWHGWARDDWDTLAGAVAAGHIIECGPQAVGGNFSGFTRIAGMRTPGFPIAEIAADGGGVITKHARDGGEVTVDTVTAQVVYEIQGPRYLNPDVTVHLDTLRLSQEGPDRVRLSGTTGSPPPPTTKVAVFGQLGYTIVNTVFATAPDVEAKVALLREQIGGDIPDGVDDLEITPLGTAAKDPADQWQATVPVRVIAAAREREPLPALNLPGRLAALYLQSIPGFFHDGGTNLVSAPRARIGYWPALLPLSDVDHQVVFEDGRTIAVPPPAGTAISPQPVHPEPADARQYDGEMCMAPLGAVAHARSGDKGGNSNVGIWVPDERAWPWLRATLSTMELRRLLPETKDLDIVRHEFPHLRAVHFVLRGLLGTGGSSNLRVDQVGKAVGEYLRAKQVLIPGTLLDGTG